MKTNNITVSVDISAPLDTVWKSFTEPEHIMQWNHASDDWRCPRAENDLRAGGRFSYRMEARDGSEGFDLEGTYADIIPGSRISYALDDGREVDVAFTSVDEGIVRVTEAFEPENLNPLEMQRDGWQAILDNLKKYIDLHLKNVL